MRDNEAVLGLEYERRLTRAEIRHVEARRRALRRHWGWQQRAWRHWHRSLLWAGMVALGISGLILGLWLKS